MKLLYFLRDVTDCGGIQQMTVTLLNEFVNKNYECSVISLIHKYEKPFFELDERVKCFSLFNAPVDTRKDFLKIKQKLNDYLNGCDVDILIVQGMGYACYISNNNWNRLSVVVCEHAYYGYGHSLGMHSLGKKIAQKRASAIVTLTSLDKNEYEKKSPKKLIVESIYNPCVVDLNIPEYNSQSKTIVSCGSLEKLKGFNKAVQIASKVLPLYDGWTWEIYGDGSERDNLQSMIDSYNLKNRVFLKGYEQDKGVIFGNKSIFVVTSSFEGFGMVIAEAMTFGIPVVSYSIKYGPLELIRNHCSGLLSEYDDNDRMAENIKSLIEDENMRMKYSCNAKKDSRMFNVEKIVIDWCNLFSRIKKYN